MFPFFLFRCFGSLIIIFQALIFARGFLTFNIHRRVRALSTNVRFIFQFFFSQHLASKAPAGISFRSVLVLRDFQRELRSRVRFIGFSCVFLIFPVFFFLLLFVHFFDFAQINLHNEHPVEVEIHNFTFLWCIILLLHTSFFRLHFGCQNVQRVNVI